MQEWCGKKCACEFPDSHHKIIQISMAEAPDCDSGPDSALTRILRNKAASLGGNGSFEGILGCVRAVLAEIEAS